MKSSPHLFLSMAALFSAACAPAVSPGMAGTGGAVGQDGATASTGGSGGSGGLHGQAGTGGPGNTGGTGGTATGGASGTGGAGTGGAATTGGINGGGGTAAAGSSGSGGRGTAGGGGSPSGGNGGARDGGAASGGSGVDGGDAGSADPRLAAGVLDGLALLKPCFSTPGTCAGCTCDENSANLLNSGMPPENQHIMKQFGGDPAVTYNVTLRVVGIAERYWYSGGTLDPTSKVFYTGGLPTIRRAQVPKNDNLAAGQGACKIHPPQTNNNYPIPFTIPPEVNAADSCYNGFNIFAMTVSSPKQSYYLNYTADFDGNDRQPHAVYKTDYTVTIPIAGQAKIDFYIIDGDHHQVANNTNLTVPNLKSTTIKQPYTGNFFELQVVDATVTAAK